MRIEASAFFLCGWYWYLLLDKSGAASVLFGSMLLHECGHLLVLWGMRVPVRAIRFTINGILIEAPRHLERKRELAALLGGCICNLAAAGLAAMCHAKQICLINLFLGLFHLLPFPGLDGGSILALFREKTEEKAEG